MRTGIRNLDMFHNPVTQRITDYLVSGGLFNPEAMEHDKVSKLLIDARAELQNYEITVRDLKRSVAQISVYPPPTDHNHCPKCGKWVRNKRFLGTLHICSAE